jgi:hypothetical protein
LTLVSLLHPRLFTMINVKPAGPNNTIIAETLFNTKRNNQIDPGPEFSITADQLHEVLFEVTLAAIYTYDF